MVRKIVVRWAVGVASFVSALLFFGTAGLVVAGIPRPPAVSTENVGRVGWGHIVDNLNHTRQTLQSTSFAAWLPDGERMLIRANYRILDSRLYVLPGPRASPSVVRSVPRNVSGIHTAPGRDHVVLRWDSDGTEQFQLYLWEPGRSGPGQSEPVRITDGRERAFFGAFEPDGDRLAYVSNRRNGADMDVYIARPSSPGSAKRVLEVDGSWAVFDWSPNKDVLLLARMYSNVRSEVYLFDLNTGKLEPLLDPGDPPSATTSAQWSSDGRSIYLISDRGTEFKHLRRLDPETGTEELIAAEIPWDVVSVKESFDGSLLVLVFNQDGRNALYTYDVASRELMPLAVPNTGLIIGAALHPGRPLLAVNHSDQIGVTRGYVYDLESGALDLWTGPEPRQADVPEPRLIRYPTFDQVHGEPRLISAFVYPGVGEGPRPVVIDIHGGPEAQARMSHGYVTVQRRGVTLIAPNVRGSTGYGKTFTSLDDTWLREDAVNDIGSLLDWIGRQPSMDAHRVAVRGGSYGGYMVLASLVHFGERIRCGVDVVGVSNFVTFLENTADYRRDLRRAEYGDERDPEMRAFLESISPLNNAERIVSPLMVIQGANDPRVPVTESRQMVARVRENGLEVQYLEGANEGHGFRHPWNSLYAQAAGAQMVTDCVGG